jgi:iron complex transport system permease protein
MLAGNDNKKLIPISCAIGASFLVIIDNVSRILSSGEIPIGILTSLIGGPFFIYLLKKTKGGSW